MPAGRQESSPPKVGLLSCVVDVPDEIVLKAANEWSPLSQGLVQFDPGAGLEELDAAWPVVAGSARIRSVT